MYGTRAGSLEEFFWLLVLNGDSFYVLTCELRYTFGVAKNGHLISWSCICGQGLLRCLLSRGWLRMVL